MNSKPTEEIKQIRHELGRQAEFSVHRIFADLRNPRQSSERKYINAVATGTTKNAANMVSAVSIGSSRVSKSASNAARCSGVIDFGSEANGFRNESLMLRRPVTLVVCPINEI